MRRLAVADIWCSVWQCVLSTEWARWSQSPRCIIIGGAFAQTRFLGTSSCILLFVLAPLSSECWSICVLNLSWHWLFFGIDRPQIYCFLMVSLSALVITFLAIAADTANHCVWINGVCFDRPQGGYAWCSKSAQISLPVDARIFCEHNSPGPVHAGILRILGEQYPVAW